MSSKKLMAAAMAAIMTVGTVSAVAFADDAATTATAKTDDYTLELVPGTYETKTEGKTTAHITASLKTTALGDLIAPATKDVPKAQIPSLNKWTLPADIDAGVVKATDLANNEYGYVDNAGALQAVATGLPTATDISIVGGITNGMQFVKVTDIGAATGASLAGATVSLVKEIVGLGSINDKANPYNKLAMGLNFTTFTPVGGTAIDVLKWSDFSMKNITMTANLVGEGTDKSTAGGVTSVKNNVARTATGSCTFADIKGRSDASETKLPTGINEQKNGNWVTSPKGMSPSFGLSASKTLDVIKAEDSEIKVEFDIEMTNTHWKDVINASGVSWNNTDTTWDVLDFEKLLNEKGDVLLATFLGVEGSSVVDWAVGTGAAANAPLQVGGIAMTSVSSSKATNVVAGEDKTESNDNWFQSGVVQATGGGAITNTTVGVQIGLGTARNNVLKNLNNGGTVTFEFDKDIRPQDVFNPYIIWSGNSGTPINLPLTLTNTYSNGGKSLTLEFPDGLTWASENTNFYNSFQMTFNLNYTNILNNTNPAMPPVGMTTVDTADTAAKNSFFRDGKDATGADNYGAKLVKITFKAKGGDNANVDNSGSTSGSTSGNNGGNTSGSKDPNGNPPTGIALAVAPVVLAAGAVVAISASKKRK